MEPPLKIAVLDDDEEDFMLLRDVIEDSYSADECQLTHFNKPEDLLPDLAENQYELCFVDYNLGAISGTQVISDLSVSHPRLPCILLTGLTDPDIDMEASESGAYEYLPKDGLNPSLLERTIRYVLKNAEQRNQLDEERHRLELVIRESPYPTISYDEECNLRNISKSFFELCGIDGKKERVSTIEDWVKLVYSGDAPEVEAFKAQLLTAADDSKSVNFTIRHSDGKQMLWRFKTVDIGRTREGHRLYVSVASDITRLTNALKQAEAANKAKSDFLSVISHELRTPLNPILGLTDIMMEEVDQPEVLEMLGIIQNSGQGLLRLIQDLLDYTSADMENFELVEKAFNFKDLMTECVDTLGTQFETRGLKLDVSYLSGCGNLAETAYCGDAQRIKQIILNLLNNALKFTNKGGVTVTLQCRNCGNERHTICIEVKDTGIGISADAQERIFEPLYQVDGSNTRSHQGTGLGLAICERLIGQMNGEISVESEPGTGTVFRIKIPLMVAEIDTNSEVAPERLQNLSGKVLVAEDAEENMIYLRRLLHKYGLVVVEAANGDEAISQFDADPEGIQLVLMDLQMPGCNGFEATEALRSRDDAGSKVPVVAVTANADAETEAYCKKVGMNDFLAKPFMSSDLTRLLEKFIGRGACQAN